jgi:hypothetical protein
MLVMVIDRRWKTAAIWSLIAALFAVCGIIHVPEAGFENFSSPTWEQCVVYDTECWPFAEQWMFFVAYLMFFATFGLVEVVRKYELDGALLPPLEDETTHAFNNWFENAAVDAHMHTRDPTEQVEEPLYDKSTMFKPDNFVEVDDPEIDETGSTHKSTSRVSFVDSEDASGHKPTPAKEVVAAEPDSDGDEEYGA